MKLTKRSTAPKTSAAAAYANNAQNTTELMKALAEALIAHEQKAKGQPLNWGFAGDLARVNEVLREALHAVGAGSEK